MEFFLRFFFWKYLRFFFEKKLRFFFSILKNFEIFFLILIRKIFLGGTSRNFKFEHSFTSKTYFCDFGIRFALVLLRVYTCFIKELWLTTFFMIFVTNFRYIFSWRIFVTKSHPTFSIYKRKIYIILKNLENCRKFREYFKTSRHSKISKITKSLENYEKETSKCSKYVF